MQALATSADGRRVALASTGQCIVRVDFDATGNATSVAWRAATGQVVASLPFDAARVPRPDRPSLSVWDLASKALVDDVETRASPALRLDVSAQTGAVFRVDRAAFSNANANANANANVNDSGDSGAPLELVRFAPGTCVAAPRVRARLADDPGASFVVDPAGRWFASARPLDAQRRPDEWAAGLRSDLVVQDIAGTRVLARTTSRFPLGGLVAAPDGSGVFAVAIPTIRAIHAIHAIDAIDAIDAPADASAVDVDQLVHIDLPDAALGALRDPAGAFAPAFCHEPGEAPGARAMARSAHLLVPAWTHDLGADMAAAGPSDADACADAAARPTPFRTADGGLWFDLGAQVVRLDPATGDTLTWRPLAAAVEPGRRRVLERRPGWVATLAPVRGDTVRVFWAHAATDGGSGVVAADYDAGGRRLRESAVDAADTLADPAAPSPEPCHDVRGTPVAIGYDWRAGPFGTQRGMTCGPLPGAARLIWWSGASIAPHVDAADTSARLAPAIDGAIGVSADATQLHVVNLALQREIAQFALGDVVAGQVWVLASRRLVLVQSTASDGHAGLRAYALP